ncbi:uncharacterized protein LOC119673889 [Teleopsis dalmanni]|uniref:uncharacterized protein LOC119673889 n=1 Tax=Teleopsis dalmanni TaxID=139649 RepID=UPI000D329DAF|nr:uncharacterized protein LOC119673889 [Teleopsis dalmanni]
MEWSREKTLCLISEYRKRRGLWDMTHDDYRKKEMKQKLLVEVSGALGGGIPINEIEKKFHTLRTQYHREINRMKRKEPYNSKWFGFKNLQFLSSPKACRSSKTRVKSEITEEGTVTTKFIIRESVSQHDSSGGSANSTTNINEEFLTINRKPSLSYDSAGNPSQALAQSIRKREFEKLIEETTKDVEEVEEPKPKMATIKEIIPIEIHAANSSDEINTAEEQESIHRVELQTHHRNQNLDEDEEDNVETIDITHNDNTELSYPTNPGVHTTLHHQHTMPTHRIIKIQRRDTCNDEDDYYDESQHQSTQQHIHAIPANTTKRFFFNTTAHQHTLITTPTNTSQPNATSTLLKALPSHQQLNNGNLLQPQQNTSTQSQPNIRDEFSTYGEYVGNEMRGITNREILISLKHKINTALFEASMAELQK